MKNSLLQNAVVQSLVASLLCGVIVFAFLRPSSSEEDGVALLMPKVSSSVRRCPLPSPQVGADGKLKLLLEREYVFEYFFPAIRERAGKSGLKDLHTHRLPAGDLELRVWDSPSFMPVQGFVLKRTNGQWNALMLPRLEKNTTGNPTMIYEEPKIGWDEFWKKLVGEGILTLPLDSCLRDYNSVKDGVTFSVEINMNGAYRIYHYATPFSHQDIPEPKQMWKIICTIFSYGCEEPARTR